MSCTKEEIERKRLAALQKRQSVLSPISQTNLNTPTKSNTVQIGPIPSSSNGAVRSFHNNTVRNHPYAKPQVVRTNEGSNVPVSKVVSGTVYLIAEDRFEVKPSEFCTPLINIFKSLPSKSYDSKSKLWNFSIKDYQELMAKVAPLAPHIVLGPIPPYVLKVLREDTMDPNAVDLSPIEATLRNKLMPFQEDGVRFGISRRGRCMIADDMGLGKTFQALAIASYYRHDWPLLIVTTSSMRETWQSKIRELLPSVPLMNVVTLTSAKDTQYVADKEKEIVIISYKIASMHTELLKNKKFGVVIIDESHYLKSHKAQCTLALGGIARRAGGRCVLLSGTPALSRPAELYTQLALIEPTLFPSYTEYGKRYCDGKQTNFGWDMTGQSNLVELQILLQKRFLIRRTKEQVLTNLEEKTRETVLLDETLLQYNQEAQEGLSQMAEAYKSSRTSDKHAALITFFSESARVKIPAICKYLKQLLEDGKTDKFLVFAHHKTVIEAICETLDEAAVPYICIVGSTPSNTRAELVDRFQHSASCRCAVLSITAASSGLTLTAANLVLFAELHWNPGILTQAESRAHRLGQARGVRVRYLLAPRTADRYMWPMLQHKLNVLNNVGLSRDTFEDTTMKHQESKNNITQYLTPLNSIPKNKNDFIPGTNIRKDSIKSDTATVGPIKSDALVVNSIKSEVSVTDSKSDESLMMMIVDSFESAQTDKNNVPSSTNGDDVDKSFLDDDEDDELLANLDL